MAKKRLKYFLIASCAASLCAAPSSSYAMDDDVKAVLGGVLGAIIVEGMKNSEAPAEQQQQEQINWNESSVQPAVKTTNYDRRTKEIQQHLKTLGFYNSTVDGISGRQTLDAIYRWEAKYDQDINGEISEEEFRYLAELAQSEELNSDLQPAGGKEDSATKNKDYEQELVSDFATLAQYQHTRKICVDFIDTGNVYASGIDFSFQRNTALFNKFYEETIAQQTTCLALSAEEIQSLRLKGQKQYEGTQEYAMYKMMVPMAVADDGIAMDMVRGCNGQSEIAVPLLEKFKDQTLNPETCKFYPIGQ